MAEGRIGVLPELTGLRTIHYRPSGGEELASLDSERLCQEVTPHRRQQAPIDNWQEVFIRLGQEFSEKMAVTIKHVSFEARLAAIEARLSQLEAKVKRATKASTKQARPVPKPKFQWLSRNADHVLKNYSGEWIAVKEAGIAGHNRSLEKLCEEMDASGETEVMYVQVEESVPT